MDYVEYNFSIEPLQPASEILIAELAQVGFESFVETETGILAYIQKDVWKESVLQGIHILGSPDFKIQFQHKIIKQVNWNSEWEKNFSPIEVDGICTVRAPFHPDTDFKYDIVIEPKMSFGTGHHETTFMMLQYILEGDFRDARVLDMGCGTAVLAILAEMRGASAIDAIDIDPWCFENSMENVERNNCQNISVYLGDASMLGKADYNVIIANINRNILLQDLPVYGKCLKKGGTLFLSGFYKEDLPVIMETCNNLGLSFVGNKEKNKWIAAQFSK